MLHKILANCIGKAIYLNTRQKAFIPADGCAENIAILNNLKNARNKHQTLSTVGNNLAKAFATPSQHSINRALGQFNIKIGIKNDVMSTYANCYTKHLLW